jgi:HEXXH motif-containing protein
MIQKVHRIPSKTFAALAEGSGGGGGARCLVGAQHSKHVLLLRRFVGLARSCTSAEACLALRAYDQLAALQAEHQEAAAAVIQHPAVGAWAKQAGDALASQERASAAELTWISALAAAVAIRSRSPFNAELSPVDGTVMIPSLGRAVTPVGNVRVTGRDVEMDGVSLSSDLNLDAAQWQAMHRLSATSEGRTIELAIDDLDPYRAPGMANAGDRLPAVEAARWQSVLEDTWDLLVRQHTAVAEEIATMVRVLTPLRSPTGGHLSATSRDASGAIFLSPPLDSVSLAVTLTHEVQHAKLSTLLDVVQMTLPDNGRRYYAPWREDPRPVSGLLQGAYAFLGVAGFWLRQSLLADGESAMAEFARWRCAVRLVIDTLFECGRMTDPGMAFLSGMDLTLSRWEAEPLSAAALKAASQASEEHRERWRQRNGEIPATAT